MLCGANALAAPKAAPAHARAQAAAAEPADAEADGPAADALPRNASPDAVTRFLADRGLIAAPAPTELSLAQQMRERASDFASGLVLSAVNFLGVPYRRGGETADEGFDCSGFTRHVFEASVGLVLPRRSAEQAKAPGLLAIDRDDLKPGDLVFFNTVRRAFSHVGIYVGDNKFIHAPRTGALVRVDDLRGSYWAKRFNGARRAQQQVDVQAVAEPSVQVSTLPPLSAAAPAPALR